MEEKFHHIKRAVLRHVQNLFEELEQSLAISHQEKYAMLEDAFESATDKEELLVALEQWYAEHEDDLELEQSVDDIWNMARASLEDGDGEDFDDDDDQEEDEEDDDDGEKKEEKD